MNPNFDDVEERDGECLFQTLQSHETNGFLRSPRRPFLVEYVAFLANRSDQDGRAHRSSVYTFERARGSASSTLRTCDLQSSLQGDSQPVLVSYPMSTRSL